MSSIVSFSSQTAACSSYKTKAPQSVSVEFLDLSKKIVQDCQKGIYFSRYSHENHKFFSNLKFNCYGFVRHLLQTICPKAYETVKAFMYANRYKIPLSIDDIPCPFHYASFFASLAEQENTYWEAIKNFKDLKGGDLIVYLPRNYVPKKNAKLDERPTGMHMMIVEEVLSLQEQHIEIMVMDSTRYRHSKEDNRMRGGIGRAPLTIHLTTSGTYQLQWGSREKRWEKELTFGRLKG